MKKFTLSGILIFLVLIVQAQTLYQGISFTFDDNNPVPPGNNIFEARDFIQFNPHAAYVPTLTNNLIARINPDLILDVNYLPDPITGDRDLNTNLPVGSIKGNFDVTSTGGATYDIPFIIPPGTNNMVPFISFNYNSNKLYSSGSLGSGWCLNGLSEISRVSKTIAQDGKVEDVKMNMQDRCSLDGNLITLMSGQWGADGSTYHTELETFSLITAHGSTGQEEGPEWYMVEAKDGRKMYYGTTNDSKIIIPGISGVYKWLLSKVEDNQGNYIEYKYLVHNNYSYINEINYTGNTRTNLSPYNKIKFYYGTRSDITTKYVLGTAMMTDLLLTEVKISNEGNQTHKYKLDYYKKNLHSCLNQIFEYGVNEDHYNSTVFDFLNTESNFHYDDFDHITQGINYYTGDFNGDGWTDFVTVYNDWYYGPDMIRIYLSRHDGGYYKCYEHGFRPPAPHELASGATILDVKIGDYNGDGRDDIMFKRNNGDGVDVGDETYNSSFDIFLLLTNGSSYGDDYCEIIDASNFFSVGPQQHDVCDLEKGDFNGDQKDEILLIAGTDLNQQNCLVLDYSSPTGYYPSYEYVQHPKYIIGRFSGVKKDEVLVLGDNSCKVYDPYAAIGSNPIYDLTYPSNSYACYPGDFNGDGKTDLLVWDNTENWKINYSKGTGFEKKDAPGLHIQDPVNYYCNYKEFVRDFNGDGLCDILEIYSPMDYTAHYSLWYSSGNNSFTPITNTVPLFPDDDNPLINTNNPAYLHLGDFNGDGSIECSYNPFRLSPDRDVVPDPAKMIYFNYNHKRELIHRITNGENLKINLEYLPLSDGNDQERFLVNNYIPYTTLGTISNYISSSYVLKSVEAPTSITTSITKSFNYEDALLNKTGRGFLGFKKVITNYSTGEIHSTTNELLTDIDLLALKSVKTEKPSGTVLASTTYSNSVYDPFQGLFFIYVSSSDHIDGLTFNECITNYNYNSPTDIDYGNLSSKTVDINQGEGTESEMYEYVQAGSWCPSKISKITNTKQRVNESSITKKIGYNYFQSGANIGLLTSVTKDPDLANRLTTSFPLYDEFGNIKEITISAADIDTRSETYEYDIKGRFKTKITNFLGQVNRIQYDVKYGKIVQIVDGNQLSTQFEYDVFGRNSKTTLPQGTIRTTNFVWDNNGTHNNALYHQSILTTGQSPQTIYYDLLCNPVQKMFKGFTNDDLVIDIKYNNIGLKDRISEPYSLTSPGTINWTNYYYDDPIYRCTQITSPSINQSFLFDRNTLVATNNLTQQTVQKIFNPFGEVSEIDEQSNTNKLIYTYNSLGQVRKIDVSGVETIIEYDPDYSYQKSLSDPDAGLTQYKYNSLNQLIEQTDHKGVITTLAYDRLGRLLSNSNPTDGSIEYIYDTEENGIGKIAQVTGYNGITTSFKYDNFSRLKKKIEQVDGTEYPTEFHYNADDFVDRIIYPNGFAINQYYNLGYLSSINKSDDNTPIYVNETINPLGQVEQYRYGNNIVTNKTFDPIDHIIKDIQVTPGGGGDQLMYYKYDHDPFNHFITGREDITRNLKETFIYDPVYLRLTNINGVNQVPSSVISYENNGNIKTIDDKTFGYGDNGGGVHAVSSVTNYSSTQQDITYTTFNKVNTISEGRDELTLTYGPDYARKVSVWKKNNEIVKIKYHLDNYEKVITDGKINKKKIGERITSELCYIKGSDGLAAVYVKNSDNTENMYYIHKDHLGSIIEITNERGLKVTSASASFDAWGNRRDPENWQPYRSSVPPLLFDRGFTGHEHYDIFGLINMNGRCYDPKVGRFLSPDIINQDPGCSQNYNRYSYCSNNPLNFSDPSGYDYDPGDSGWDDEVDGADWNVNIHIGSIRFPDWLNDFFIWNGNLKENEYYETPEIDIHFEIQSVPMTEEDLMESYASQDNPVYESDVNPDNSSGYDINFKSSGNDGMNPVNSNSLSEGVDAVYGRGNSPGGRFYGEEVKNYGGVKGLNVISYYGFSPNPNRIGYVMQSGGVVIELNYSSPLISTNAKWSQLISTTDPTCGRTSPYYDDMDPSSCEHIGNFYYPYQNTVGNTASFYDNPARSVSCSWSAYLFLTQNGNILLTLHYGYTISNGITNISPLRVVTH